MEQNDAPRPLSAEELAAETGAALPDKEVISLLDLNADLDLALDAAAPIDLAVAANANVAAPIDAAVGANVLSVDSTAQALADQGVLIDQGITGETVANAPQDSTIDQSDDTVGADHCGIARIDRIERQSIALRQRHDLAAAARDDLEKPIVFGHRA